MNKNLTFLCIASYFKGAEFLRQAKREGVKVILLTDKRLEHEAWPREFIDEVILMESEELGVWNMEHLISGLAYKMRSEKIDRIVAMDDFDVEKAAELREHFRIPGMGQTTYRYFRDKLAMRMKAQEEGIPVPAFSALFNDAEVHEYTQNVPAPWMVKPRGEASAAGIKKVNSTEELWQILEQLGDERHAFLIEKFTPGIVYHVDAITADSKVVFARGSEYLDTPMEVAHGGGIFRTVTVPYNSKDDKGLKSAHKKLMKAFGMNYSASHSEFIKSNEDGKFYFLETASRVGGAHIAEQLEASSGMNIWGEWAKLEIAKANDAPYKFPKVENLYAGLIVSLARDKHPDMSSFNDEEVYWNISKEYHIGFIVKSKSRERVLELLENYAQRIAKDFHAALPAADKPTS
jgi:biotin carboxylase